MYAGSRDTAPVTVRTLARLKSDGEPIAVLTAYDATFARVMDQAGVDVVLVGDSLGMVIQGQSSTLPVTMDQMVYHCAAVSRGAQRPLLIGDLPFLSYRDEATALHNAGRLMAEGGVGMVKVEGAGPVVAVTRRLVDAGIPVCAHLGLQPQSVNRLGGYRVQGREAADAEKMLEDAHALAAAGASLLVLECIPAELAGRLTAALPIPTIGIGAGVDCDGQVLVLHDMLGLSPRAPRFVRDFAAGADSIPAAIARYVEAVKSRAFPSAEECYQ